jgi:MOSC domain-containing protein YiiM
MAVYSYPAEHYDYWRKQFPNMDLMEDDVNIGDQFQIGSAKLVATQPRMPCYKLGVRFVSS